MEQEWKEDRKKITLYLHPGEPADSMALSQIDKVPRKVRGELYRQALVSGLALHQIDPRLPAVLAALFTQSLTADQVIMQLAQITGWKPSLVSVQDILSVLDKACITGEPDTAETEDSSKLDEARRRMKALM